MTEECQNNARQWQNEILHEAQYARSYEASERHVGPLLKTTKAVAKGGIGRPLNNWNRENQQGWRHDRYFKNERYDFQGIVRDPWEMLKPSNILAPSLKLSHTLPLNFEDTSIMLPINTSFIFHLFSVLGHSCHYKLNLVKQKIK